MKILEEQNTKKLFGAKYSDHHSSDSEDAIYWTKGAWGFSCSLDIGPTLGAFGLPVEKKNLES